MEVTSAEFKTRFGYYREVAQREPVEVTAHGRVSLVVLSAEEYKRLKEHDRQTGYMWEMDDDWLAAVEAAEPAPEAQAFDHEYPPEDE